MSQVSVLWQEIASRPDSWGFISIPLVPAHLLVVKGWMLKLAGLFNPQARDAAELLPRYGVDNLFVSQKFKARFPAFRGTTFREGLAAIAHGDRHH